MAGDPWAPWELALLEDPEWTDEDVADETKRTVSSVYQFRWRRAHGHRPVPRRTLVAPETESVRLDHVRVGDSIYRSKGNVATVVQSQRDDNSRLDGSWWRITCTGSKGGTFVIRHGPGFVVKRIIPTV